MKKFNLNRKTLYTLLCIVAITILTLTVAYAALSTTLNITGSAKVNASSWNIKFRPNDRYSTTGSATYTEPTINNTRIDNYSVTLTKPGDSVTMIFPIENVGTLNGEVDSIISSTPICTSLDNNPYDEALICDNLEISITYNNDMPITPGDVLKEGSSVCLVNGEKINSTTAIKIKIGLKETMNSVSRTKVVISNLSHEVIYKQTDKKCEMNAPEK